MRRGVGVRIKVKFRRGREGRKEAVGVRRR